MERLPIKFEQEVLEKHGIQFIDDCGYMNYDRFINKYELIGYGIEAARLQLIPMEPNTCFDFFLHHYLNTKDQDLTDEAYKLKQKYIQYYEDNNNIELK